MHTRRPHLSVFVILVGLFFVFACAAENPSDPAGVKSACEARLSWKRLGESKCTECTASARLQKCDCPALTESSGKCANEGTAVFREATCTDAIRKCAETCKADCACVDKCYASAPECKAKTGALDSCIVSVCSTICQ